MKIAGVCVCGVYTLMREYLWSQMQIITLAFVGFSFLSFFLDADFDFGVIFLQKKMEK